MCVCVCVYGVCVYSVYGVCVGGRAEAYLTPDDGADLVVGGRGRS